MKHTNSCTRKIILNLVTVGVEGIPIDWLIKFKQIEKLNYSLYLNSGLSITNFTLRGITTYKFNQSFNEFKRMESNKKSSLQFMWHALKRNLYSIFRIQKILQIHPQIIYSPSAVLDLVLIPYLIKTLSPKIVWSVVFDNTVPFSVPGNKITTTLAWCFFQISVLLIKKADVIITVSQDLKDYLINKKINAKKIMVRTNGIERNLITKAKIQKSLTTDILYIGRINKAKGVFDLVDVLEIVKKRYPKIKMGIMGQGDIKIEIELKKYIAHKKLINNVCFFGFQSGQTKLNILKSSKVFVSLSYSESFGTTVLEAVCSGKPTFVYDLPTYRNLYQNHEVITSTKGNIKSVALKIIKLFQKKKFQNTNGQKMLFKFNWNTLAKQEIAFIEHLTIHKMN